MTDKIPDPKAKEMVDRIINKNNDKILNEPNFYTNIIKFLIDFGVFPFAIGWLIAISFSDFYNSLWDQIFSSINYEFLQNILLQRLIKFLMGILLLYLFIEHIFYKKLYTKEVSLQGKVEEVIQDKEKEKIEKKININALEKTATKEIIKDNIIVEPYNNDNFFYYN